LILVALAGLLPAARGQQCSTTTGPVSTVRGQGLSEQVADILLQCQGFDSPTPAPLTAQIFLSAPVTTSARRGLPQLVFDGPGGSPLPGLPPISGVLTGAGGVEFSGIDLSQVPSAAGMRIANIRANMTFGSAPETVFGSVGVFQNTVPLPVSPSRLMLARAVPAMHFRVTQSASFEDCQVQNANIRNLAPGFRIQTSARVRFAETFPTAFRVGDRLTARLTNVPRETRVYVTDGGLTFGGPPVTLGFSLRGGTPPIAGAGPNGEPIAEVAVEGPARTANLV
jgi:hypothetical protein